MIALGASPPSGNGEPATCVNAPLLPTENTEMSLEALQTQNSLPAWLQFQVGRLYERARCVRDCEHCVDLEECWGTNICKRLEELRVQEQPTRGTETDTKGNAA